MAIKEFSHMVRVNQDSLGSREKSLKLFNESLSEGKDVILDRCNISAKQRKEWLKIAKLYKASCHAVYLEVPTNICVQRMSRRENHETISNKLSIDKLRSIVLKFNNELELPTFNEPFDSILLIKFKL